MMLALRAHGRSIAAQLLSEPWHSNGEQGKTISRRATSEL